MDSHRKSLLKALSWRVIGSLGTFLVAWWMSGDLLTGASISFAEFFLKIVLFYLHERAWSRFK